MEEGRVPLGQVLWNVRFLHFGPQNLLRSPPWHVHQEDARKWPSFLVLSCSSPHVPSAESSGHGALSSPPQAQSLLTWGSGEDGGDESHARHLCLQVRPVGTSPTHTSRSPGRSRKPPCHPLGGPRGGVDSMACLWWGICVLGLGLNLLPGVLLGRGSGSLGPQMLPTLSLVSVGTRPWGRVSMPGLG